jgi:hypothetical protein
VAGEAILGEPPTEIRAELRQLAARLDAGVPREQRGENVLVATWNIRAFGDLNETWRAGRGTKTAREESLRCIAEVVSRFDAAAIQEVNGNIKALRHLLKGAGAEPGFISPTSSSPRPATTSGSPSCSTPTGPSSEGSPASSSCRAHGPARSRPT